MSTAFLRQNVFVFIATLCFSFSICAYPSWIWGSSSSCPSNQSDLSSLNESKKKSDTYKSMKSVISTLDIVSSMYRRWYCNRVNTKKGSRQRITSIEYLDVENEDDLKAVMDIIRDIQKDEEQVRLIRKAVKERFSTMVARVHNTIVGFISFDLEGEKGVPPTDSWIRLVAIKKEHRSQGYATVLLQRVLEELNKEGKHSVGVITGSNNLRSKPLYERAGLKKIAVITDKDGTTNDLRVGNLTWWGSLYDFVSRIKF